MTKKDREGPGSPDAKSGGHHGAPIDTPQLGGEGAPDASDRGAGTTGGGSGVGGNIVGKAGGVTGRAPAGSTKGDTKGDNARG